MISSVGPGLIPLRPRWRIPGDIDPAGFASLGSDLDLPAPALRILARRGFSDLDSVRGFLRPGPADLHPATLLAGMANAVSRLAEAREGKEIVLVHGDYDVDGICSTAMLVRAFGMMGIRAEPFVPHRMRDGYDLTSAGIEAARRVGAGLIVTVDCGVVAHRAVEEARAAGIDVIVTDHHAPGDRLPDAIAVVNPNRADCDYPEKGLAGVGVAYKLLVALAGAIGFPVKRLTAFLDLVAIATIADLAPVGGENRALVRWGLSVLARTPNPGIRALMASCGLGDEREPTAGQIGYVLAPRLNAAGRMGDAMRAVRMLTTDDRSVADALAAELEGENRLRREVDEQTLAEALAMLEEGYDPDEDFGVVLASDRWHAGVIGIVASRLVERIHRPTILIAVSGNEGKGSGRSIPGLHLQRTLVTCQEHLIRFGGHRAAAGCSIDPARIDDFRAAFNAAVRDSIDGEALQPVLRIDDEISLAEVTDRLHRTLRHFAPFGIGNPTPVFAARGVTMGAPPRIVGRNHLKLVLESDGRRLEAIGFDMGDRLAECIGGPIDVAFRIEENRWTDRSGRERPPSLQARIIDLAAAAG